MWSLIKNYSSYEFEYTCIACGYNVIKRKHELSKIQRKKINFINRLKYAEQKTFYICVDVYNIYEGNDYDKIYEVLSTLKNKKRNLNKIFFEKKKIRWKVLILNKTSIQ